MRRASHRVVTVVLAFVLVVATVPGVVPAAALAAPAESAFDSDGTDALTSRSTGADASTCGGENQTPCTVGPATLEGRSSSRSCPSNTFLDPINGGTCWSCPSGFQRTVFAVDGTTACERAASTASSSASRRGRGTGLLGTNCPRGQFWDPNGYCYTCPSGYNRTAAPVTGRNACAKSVAASYAKATLQASLFCPAGSFFDLIDGGTCWSCPSGYSRTLSPVKAADACAAAPLAGVGAEFGACNVDLLNIRGTCVARGKCGGENQRPCLTGERLPSCNEGLKENFKKNVCEALRPGETPFTGGLASISEFAPGYVQNTCTNVGGLVSVPGLSPAATFGNCSKDVLVGFGCAYIASKLPGSSTLSAVNAVLETGPVAAQYAQQIDKAYAGDCGAAFKEQLSKATRVKTAAQPFGQDCPSGSFWDPNGGCYTCPAGTTRTLNSVTGSAACVDKLAGEMARLLCSVGAATLKQFGSGISCTAEILQNGTFVDRELDFSLATRQVCLTTGEFTFNLVDLFATPTAKPADKGKEVQTRLQKYIAKIKDSDMYRTGTKVAQVAGTGQSGAEVASAWTSLTSCNLGGP